MGKQTIKYTSRASKIIYWLTTTIIILAFFITGIGNLLPFQHIANDMIHLGYPSYFLKILGSWKILAAITFVLPLPKTFKNAAYTGMLIDLSGAALSRFFIGDDISMVFIPLLISGVVLCSWFLRPNSSH